MVLWWVGGWAAQKHGGGGGCGRGQAAAAAPGNRGGGSSLRRDTGARGRRSNELFAETVKQGKAGRGREAGPQGGEGERWGKRAKVTL